MFCASWNFVMYLANMRQDEHILQDAIKE